MDPVGLEQIPKAKMVLSYYLKRIWFLPVWIRTISAKGIKLYDRCKWEQNLVFYFSIYEKTAPKIVFGHGSSSQVGRVGAGGRLPFNYSSAQQDTVAEMCLPSGVVLLSIPYLAKEKSKELCCSRLCSSAAYPSLLRHVCNEAHFLK